MQCRYRAPVVAERVKPALHHFTDPRMLAPPVAPQARPRCRWNGWRKVVCRQHSAHFLWRYPVRGLTGTGRLPMI